MSLQETRSQFGLSRQDVSVVVERLLLVFTLAFIFVLPWRAMVTLEAFGGQTIAVPIGLSMFFLFIANKISDPTIQRPHSIHMLFIILVVWTILSLVWSVERSATASALIRPMLAIGMVIIMWDILTTWEDVLQSFRWYVHGGWILSALVVYEFLFDVASTTTYGSARYVGVGAAAPNILATMVTFGTLLAWFVYTNTNGLSKYIYLLYIPCSIFVVFLTGSRHGFILLTIPIAYICLSLFSHRGFDLDLVSLLLIALGAIVTYLYSPGIARISTIPEEILYGDLNNRIFLWQEAILTWSENPIFGIGYYTFRTFVGSSPHNGPLLVLVSLGLVGLLVYVAIHIKIFQVAMSSKPNIRYFSVGLLVIILLAHAAQSIIYNPIIWFLMNSIVLLYYVEEHEKTVTASVHSFE